MLKGRACLAASSILASVAACSPLPDKVTPPTVALVSLRPVELGLFEQRFQLGLRVENPNAVDIPIAGLRYTLHLNGVELAHGTTQETLVLPAHGEKRFTVPLNASLAQLWQQFKALQQGHLAYRLVGDLSIQNHSKTLPFDYSGQIDFKP